jgi:hypothetical protein
MHESINMENVQRIVDDAILKLKQGDESNAIWAASYARGGNNPVGSLTWHDWRDMELIPNFKQVVGHTPVSKIQTISDNVINSVIVNVDSSGSRVYHSEVLEIDENGNRQILNTSYV